MASPTTQQIGRPSHVMRSQGPRRTLQLRPPCSRARWWRRAASRAAIEAATRRRATPGLGGAVGLGGGLAGTWAMAHVTHGRIRCATKPAACCTHNTLCPVKRWSRLPFWPSVRSYTYTDLSALPVAKRRDSSRRTAESAFPT